MADMNRISVNLPVLSTVNLPDAENVVSGHATGMDLKVILRNIDRRLNALGISQDKASTLARRPDAIRNLRRKVESGTRGSLRADTLDALAIALQTNVADLTSSEEPPAVGPIIGMREYLIDQRNLIDRKLAELDAAEHMRAKKSRRNNAR